MKLAGFFLYLPVLILLFSCGHREEIDYYPTGEIKRRVILDLQGGFTGNITHYFRNGRVERVVPFNNHLINGAVKYYDSIGQLRIVEDWINGELNGKKTFFYPNGVIESTETWKGGKLAGAIKQYYPNSRIEYEAIKFGNRYADTARYYHSNGKVAQWIVYDSVGRKIDFAAWNRAGILDPAYIKAIFLSDRDTITQGEDYFFEIRLGNRRSNVIIIKPLVPASQLDSIKGKYARTRFLVKHPTPGIHVLKAKIYESWARKGSDTVWTNDHQVEHTFLVRKRQ